jgi:hypothetical protein
MTDSGCVLMPVEYWFEDFHAATKQHDRVVRKRGTGLLTRLRQLNEGRSV